jgi:hypothetical protein
MFECTKWQPNHCSLLRRKQLAQTDIVCDQSSNNAESTSTFLKADLASEFGSSEEHKGKGKETKQCDERSRFTEGDDAELGLLTDDSLLRMRSNLQ